MKDWELFTFRTRWFCARRAYRQERIRLSERVRAGLAKERKNGKVLGRRTQANVTPDQVRELRASGLNWSQISRQLGCARSTLRLYAQQHATG